MRTDDPGSRLRVWLERRGRVDGDFIKYEPNSRNTPPDIIQRQGILETLPLFGILDLQDVTPEQLVAVGEDRTGDPEYIRLGKRAVRKAVYPSILRFLKILRTNYGQYWLSLPEPWDSRTQSLGRYCELWSMKWSLDRTTWTPFLPDESKIEPLTATLGPTQLYLEFLTKSDWQQIRSLAATQYEPSLALDALRRAHEEVDQGELRHALIEAVTALELAVEEYVKRFSGQNNLLDAALSQFWDAGTQQKFSIVAAASRLISPEDINVCFEVIRERNRATHEGWEPIPETKGKLQRFLSLASKFFEHSVKFPLGYAGNALMSVEQWDEAYRQGRLV